jgi:hypothetical protein
MPATGQGESEKGPGRPGADDEDVHTIGDGCPAVKFTAAAANPGRQVPSSFREREPPAAMKEEPEWMR